MSFLQDATKENLKQFGIEGLSFTMPATTMQLVNEDTETPAISFDISTFTLDAGDTEWMAPFAGILNETNSGAHRIKYNLQKTDGSMVNENGGILRLFPQQILRLKRLLALKFEDTNEHNPQKQNGIPKRQVPAFVFIADDDTTGLVQGIVAAGAGTGLSGKISFYDEQGFILHPLYVVSLIKSLINIYPALDIDKDNSKSKQLDHILALDATHKSTVRLVKADGKPYSGEHIEGITAIAATALTPALSSIGLFDLDNYTGTDTTLKAELSRAAVSTEFTAKKAKQLLLSNVSYGRLMDKVPLLKLPATLTASNTLSHDFFTVRVVMLDTYLRGNPHETFIASKLEPKPEIRLNEQLSLLSSGNQIIGKISSIFSGTISEALCAATAIDTKKVLPTDANQVFWPEFPSASVVPDTTLPSSLKSELSAHSVASFITESDSADKIDVVLTLSGVPLGASIRVFNRVFLNDAVLKRGNGAGGVCTTELPDTAATTLKGELKLLLKDPLGLRRPEGTVTVPTDPKLILDIMIVLNNGTKRLFGAITIPVNNDPTSAPIRSDNVLEGVSKKSVSNAGILGLGKNTSGIFDFGSLNATLNTIIKLSPDAPLRDGGRLPTMVRRDLLAAAKKGSNWQAILSGGQINGNLHNTNQDLGCPGSEGGNETANIGVYTQDAQLAYDLARFTFRRTTNIYQRINALSDATWNEPLANTALAENAGSLVGIGTFAGSLLQNIAPYCESPELALLKTAVEDNIESIPDNFNAFADKLIEWINAISTSLMPAELTTAANKLKGEFVTTLTTLKANTALSEAKKELLLQELKRELSCSCFGRRDSQWALKQAFEQARQFIYIETPGISFTAGAASADYVVDLFAALNAQLTAKPGLRVIICVPRQPDYQKQYDQWIRSEVKERLSIIQALPSTQVVAFHPIGFPGRASNLEQTTIIIDDQWALIGSCALRRRGLTFDGSSDIVFTDCDTINGVATSISNLRKDIMKQRLGIPTDDESSSRSLLLHDFGTSFALVRQTLVAGGLGKIERLWNGHTEGIEFIEPTINKAVANPDGIEFNAFEAAVFTAFADLAK